VGRGLQQQGFTTTTGEPRDAGICRRTGLVASTGGGPGRRYWFRLDEKTAAAIEATKTNLHKNLSPYQRRILLSQEVHYA
jgi:hypothetical protein